MMNKSTLNSLATIGVIAIWIAIAIYGLVCTVQTIDILTTLGGFSMLPFKPSFSVDRLVRSDRRYNETTRTRNFGGLHTPAYRVFNALSKMLLDAKLYSACVTMTSRSQYKHISYKSLFSVTIAYGYSAVSIGARTIFAVDEWTREIYHIDSTGRLAVTPYYQGYDMTDVIAQIAECVEVLKECYVPVASEPVEETQWDLLAVHQDRPQLKPIKGAKESVRATLLKQSRNLIKWKVEWYDVNNPSRTRIESGVWAKAYKVEIDGVVAWLPHSVLGEIYSTPWAYARVARPVATIDVPQWWYIKNITPHLNLPF